MTLILRTLAGLSFAAAMASPALAKGDVDAGRQKAYTCAGCHGITGYKNAYPTYHVPRIAGQNYEYLKAALHEYAKGERKHPTMQAQAESFSEEDIDDIATFLSSLSEEGTK